ncbi:MAG: hypothetical protein J7K68_04885 [Candidatus Diapherotrites archaeon]|nr:hypothetical protein [Candidatus Diapherotrites archaeon]
MLNIYDKSYYKFYLVIPTILVVISLILIPNIQQGIDLKGGTSITVQLPSGVDVDVHKIESALEQKNVGQVNVRVIENPVSGTKGLIIEYSGNPDLLKARALLDKDPEKAMEIAKKYVTLEEDKNYEPADVVLMAEAQFRSEVASLLSSLLGAAEEQISVREVGPSFSKTFWEQGQRAVILAFIFMAIIVFVSFRKIAPSSYVVLSAIIDIIVALGAMSLFGIPLTLATIAALLMLIGYSVDTDIMLTTRVLKRGGGTISKRIQDAMITGLTMTGTTLVVLAILAISSYLAQITVLFQIAAVLLCGLTADLASTWFMNAVILKWWMEKQSS